MKKIFFLCAFWGMASMTNAFSQINTNLFRLVTKENINGKKQSFEHDLGNNKVISVALDNTNVDAKTGYLQSMIVYPSGNNNLGKVLIASGKDNNRFLRRPSSLNTQGVNELSFDKVTDTNNLTDFTWEFIYAGNDTIILSPFGTSQPMGAFINNGKLVLEVLKNTSNANLGAGQTANSKYKFSLQKLGNVF